jgi:hypothetical protein
MTRLVKTAVALLAVACAGAEERSDPAAWTTVVDTIGDTIITRTSGVADSAATHTLVEEVTIGELDAQDEYSFGGINELEAAEDGRIYVFDRQVPALREYDAAGKFVRTIGRKGAGPGEYTQANGVAIHRDGRIVLWDAGTAHINVYRPDGTFITSWPLPGGSGFYTSGALFVDTAGNTYARTRIGDPPKDNAAASGRMFGTTGLVKWDRDGKIVDSLTPPPQTVEPQSLVASRDGGTSVSSVPFSPRHMWVWSPLGYFISAQSDRYSIIFDPPDGPVRRVEREAKPVSLDGDERAYYEERSTASMRMTDPAWRWSGPSIPTVKGAINSLAPADDGRIWVSVAQPGQRVPEGELPPPPQVRVGDVNAVKMPPVRWRDPSVYDVFDPTGYYLGRVAAPPKTTFRTMRGDQVWAVRRDSLDVEQVVRFRVVPGFKEQKVDDSGR